MAKVRGYLGEVLGTVDGVTFSRNRYGVYVKARAYPKQPNSTEQQLARSLFTQAACGWRGLAQSVRDQWDAYGAATKTSLPGGDSGYLPGFAWYVACRTVAQRVGYTGSLVCPAVGSGILASGVLDDVTVTLGAGSLSFGTGCWSPGASHCLIWVCETSTGANVAAGRWVLRYAGTVGDVESIAVGSQRVFVRVRCYKATTGQISDLYVGGPIVES